MRSGDRLVIYLDKMTPNFNTEYNFPSKLWPSYDIFDFKKWRSNDTYMKVVKKEEDYDMKKTKDRYFMNDNFQLIVLATY